MADTTVGYTPGTGAKVAVDDLGAGGLVQRIKPTFGAPGSATDVSSSNPLPVVQTGTPELPTGAATEATLDDVKAALTIGPVPVSGTFWQATQPVSVASLPLPADAATETTLAGVLTEGDFDTKTGSLTETAPSTDTASSGLNGRLQRIAQRLTSLIALFPSALSALSNFKISVADIGGTAPDTNSGSKSAGTLRVVLATDQPQLTNKLLVTPDANSAVNVAQMNGVAVTMGAGNSGTGVQRVVIATDQPALTNKLLVTPDANSTVIAGERTDSIYNSTTALTPKFAAIAASSSGNNTLVAAVTGKKIRVLAYNLIGNGAVNAKFQSGASGTDLTGLKYIAAAGGGICAPYNPMGWFETAAATLLNLNLSGAVAVGGELVYVEV